MGDHRCEQSISIRGMASRKTKFVLIAQRRPPDVNKNAKRIRAVSFSGSDLAGVRAKRLAPSAKEKGTLLGA